jgi:hypothetical protein
MAVFLKEEKDGKNFLTIAENSKENISKGQYAVQFSYFKGKVFLHIQGILNFFYLFHEICKSCNFDGEYSLCNLSVLIL